VTQPETPEEQPAAPEAPTPPVPATATEGRPRWTYFLTPIAVLVGSVIIGGFVLLGWALFGDDDASAQPPVVAEQPITEGGVSSVPASPTPVGSLKTVFTGYVQQLGLDTDKWVQCAANQATADFINNQIKEGAQLGVTGTPTFFINNKMLVGAQPFSVLKEVIDAELNGSPTTIDGYSDTIKAMASQDPPYFKILDTKPDITGAEIEGSKDAKVMVVEFSDFQCPFCERWYQDDLPQLRKMLGPDVALAFLNFPIPQLHPNAGTAAMAAQCAAEQGKFWQMHDLLFSNQAAWQGLPTS
jgi:protein-disulfide isomerase